METTTDLLLHVGETEYQVHFTHLGPVTLCAIIWRKPNGYHVCLEGGAMCHPKDEYSAAAGEKIAMRRACGISNPGEYYQRLSPHRALYDAYRAHLHEADKWKKFLESQPEPAPQGHVYKLRDERHYRGEGNR